MLVTFPLALELLRSSEEQLDNTWFHAGLVAIVLGELTWAINLLGLPSVAVPTGTVDGLPMGVQLVGRRFREDLCLDAAEAIESRHPLATPVDPAP